MQVDQVGNVSYSTRTTVLKTHSLLLYLKKKHTTLLVICLSLTEIIYIYKYIYHGWICVHKYNICNLNKLESSLL